MEREINAPRDVRGMVWSTGCGPFHDGVSTQLGLAIVGAQWHASHFCFWDGQPSVQPSIGHQVAPLSFYLTLFFLNQCLCPFSAIKYDHISLDSGQFIIFIYHREMGFSSKLSSGCFMDASPQNGRLQFQQTSVWCGSSLPTVSEQQTW